MPSTCGVRLAVVLPTVLHFDGRQAEGLDHLVGALAPVRGAESQDGEAQSQGGQGQGEQGARPTGHTLQHGQSGEGGGAAGGGQREREIGGVGGRGKGKRGQGVVADGGVRAGPDGLKR